MNAGFEDSQGGAKMSWTDERVELLKKLWGEGLSASQIAARLGQGITRNAVIGKVHRLNLSGRAQPPRSTVPRAPRKPREPSHPGRTTGMPSMPTAATRISSSVIWIPSIWMTSRSRFDRSVASQAFILALDNATK